MFMRVGGCTWVSPVSERDYSINLTLYIHILKKTSSSKKNVLNVLYIYSIF